MNKLDEQRQKEIQQAEELLFTGPQALGFAKGLFQGHFVSDWVMPYPRIAEAERGQLDQTLAELRKFLNEQLDPAEIDRQADIPRSVVDGLGRIGVLGMTAPKESDDVAHRHQFSLTRITLLVFARCCCSARPTKNRNGFRNW